MSHQEFDDCIEADIIDVSDTEEPAVIEASPTTKLERRRRIEDLFEEKRLREELGEFDLL